MPDNAAFRDFVELVDEKDRASKLHVGFALRISVLGHRAPRQVDMVGIVQHDGRFHFAGVAHSAHSDSRTSRSVLAANVNRKRTRIVFRAPQFQLA